MKSYLLLLFISVPLLLLSGCVEIRDESEPTAGDAPVTPSMVEEVKGDKLVIEGEVFIFKGKLLQKKELEFEMYRAGQKTLPRETGDFEFRFAELVFVEGAILNTMGHRVRFHVDKLNVSQGALIRTFPELTKAPKGVVGRSGGHLFLNIGTGRGRLAIEMRGEAGGDGYDGPPPTPNMNGANGRTITVGCSSTSQDLIPSFGGDGKQGHGGESGRNGGHSGTLELSIQKEIGFSVYLTKHPGKGGAGGLGGAGGKGGIDGSRIPGPSGKGGRFCKVQVDRARGADGPVGPTGTEGTSGIAQAACVTRDGKATCF
nr:hypothetical protein HAGR004_06690 [Bdellovibrio sp. HAGR004]